MAGASTALGASARAATRTFMSCVPTTNSPMCSTRIAR